MGKVTFPTFPNSIRKTHNYYVFHSKICVLGSICENATQPSNRTTFLKHKTWRFETKSRKRGNFGFPASKIFKKRWQKWMFPRTETEILHFTFSPESLILLEGINGRDAYEAHVAGSTGGIPEPLLFLSNIKDSGEKVKCSISVSVRGNIHFCCRILNILEAGKQRNPTFSWFCLKTLRFIL